MNLPIESLTMSAELLWAFLTMVATLVGAVFVPRG